MSKDNVRVPLAPGSREPSPAVSAASGFDPSREWPDPTPEMLTTPEFEAVWQCIRSWDVNVPSAYSGYCGANGNHVRAILDALDRVKPLTSELCQALVELLPEGWGDDDTMDHMPGVKKARLAIARARNA